MGSIEYRKSPRYTLKTVSILPDDVVVYSPKKNDDDAGYKNEIRMKNGLALGDGSNRASGVSIGISKPLFFIGLF